MLQKAVLVPVMLDKILKYALEQYSPVRVVKVGGGGGA